MNGVDVPVSWLGRLLHESRFASPDRLGTLVAVSAREAGAREAIVYLADYAQHFLVPLTGDGVAVRDPLQIDATLGGRAFRTLETLETDVDGGCRLWTPLLDGTTRVGVLEVVFGDVGEARVHHAEELAALVAELVMVKNLYGDAFAKLRRRRELSLAAEMQWSLLPPLTFATPEVVISGILEPSYDISGDTFDYAMNGDTAHVAIVDAMGHGFEAALMATVAVGSYRHSRRQSVDLARTYTAMDDVISARFGTEQFVTAQLAELNGRTGVLRWLNAGHPSPLLVRDGALVGPLACAPTLPAGFGDGVAEIVEEPLQPGDRVLFYSDGVVESRSPDGEFFGEERLGDFLMRSNMAGLAGPETVRRLAQAILEHQGGTLQDDATTLLLEWRGVTADQPLP